MVRKLQHNFPNTGTINASSGWVSLGVKNTTATLFNMDAGTLDALWKLNVGSGCKADLRVYNGVIDVANMTDLSSDFTLDFRNSEIVVLTVFST